MSLVEVSAINYIVMVVGACTPLKWDYQDEDTRTEYPKLYKVTGMPIMSKDADNIEHLDELVVLAKEGREVEVIIDTKVNENQLIMVQEVLNHGNTSVGTYLDTTPHKNEQGEAMYTGIVMGKTEDGDVNVYTLQGESGDPEQWVVGGGIELADFNSPTTGDKVKLGGAIRFLAKDSDISDVPGGNYRILSNIDVINKYV